MLPEIIDRTIDHLHDDKISLKSCSLVSRPWLNTSRFHLFMAMHVRSVRNEEPERPFAHFLHFLKTSPDAAFHIRNLSILGGDAMGFYFGPPNTGICMHELQDVLVHLPRLLKLEIGSLILEACHRERCKDQPSPFSPVPLDTLCFYQACAAENLTSLSQFLDLFSTIRRLRVDELSCSEPNRRTQQVTIEQSSELSLNFQCRELVGGVHMTEKIYPLLRWSKSTHTLSYISVWPRGREALNALGELIGGCGTALEKLSLNLQLLDVRQWPTGKILPVLFLETLADRVSYQVLMLGLDVCHYTPLQTCVVSLSRYSIIATTHLETPFFMLQMRSSGGNVLLCWISCPLSPILALSVILGYM